jgi:hypothetical protein
MGYIGASGESIRLKRIPKKDLPPERKENPFIPNNENIKNERERKKKETRFIVKETWIGLPGWGPNRDRSYEKHNPDLKKMDSDYANADRLSWLLNDLKYLEKVYEKAPDNYRMKKTELSPYIYFRILLEEYKMARGYLWFLGYAKNLEKDIIEDLIYDHYKSSEKIPSTYRGYWQAFRLSQIFLKIIEEIQKGKKLTKSFMDKRKEEYEKVKLARPEKQVVIPRKPSTPERKNSHIPPPFSSNQEFARTWNQLSNFSFNRFEVSENQSERMRLNSWIRDFLRLAESHKTPSINFSHPAVEEFYHFYLGYLAKHTDLGQATVWLEESHQKPKKDWTDIECQVLVLIVQHYILAITYFQTGKKNFERDFKSRHERFVKDFNDLFSG